MDHGKFHSRILGQLNRCPDISQEIVKAVIELIDPVRSSRRDVKDLEKTEKTYIGTKVEIILRYKLAVQKGKVQDCEIDGTEFDIKCTVGKNWMVPREAVGHYCLVVKIDWEARKISIGTFLAEQTHLSAGQNQDQKRTISKSGKMTIKWVYVDKTFQIPTNVPYVEWRAA